MTDIVPRLIVVIRHRDIGPQMQFDIVHRPTDLFCALPDERDLPAHEFLISSTHQDNAIGDSPHILSIRG